MKKMLLKILSVSFCCILAACSSSETGNNKSVYSSNTYSSYSCSHSYTAATCTSASKCVYCGVTKGTSLGHSYSGAYCIRCSAKNPNYTQTTQSNQQNHTHYYSSRVTTEATCAKTGVRTYTCSCGKSYTETISKSTTHNWKYATCTTPDTCTVCKTTRGSAKGHNYSNDGDCFNCNAKDPVVDSTLSKCSLELPVLPKSVSYYGYSNKLYSTVKVTAISYQFEYYGDGKVILTAKFSGEKTYDYRGSGQSDSCKIGWKLYAPDGSVFRTGTFTSPNVAMGEKFSNQEEDLIYNFEASQPGRYRLVILDTN